MKSFFFLIFIVGLPFIATAHYNNNMNPREKILLQYIDEVCGNTWCEGSYNFDFHEIYCRAWNDKTSQCILEFEMFEHPVHHYTKDGHVTAYRMIKHPSTCEINKLPHLPKNPERAEALKFYNEFIHDPLSNCINLLEDNLRSLITQN